MNAKFAAFALPLLACTASHGAVSMVFSEVDKPILSGLRSTDGSQSSGLYWGVVVSSLGSSFDSLIVEPGGTLLQNGADFGNGLIFFEAGLNTIDITSDLTSGEFGDGVALSADFSPFDIGNASIGAGDAVAIVWFDSAVGGGSSLTPGSNYGIITPSEVTNNPSANALPLPADGQGLDYTDRFQGAEPVRLANLEFVPEPSTTLLAFLGLAGLLRRRR